jgi:hypothetical protein
MTIDQRLALCFALGAVCAGAWADDDVPQPKPGLWEIAVHSQTAASAPTTTSQRCVGTVAAVAPASAAASRIKGKKGAPIPPAKTACERKSFQKLANGVEVEMACKDSHGNSVATTRITGDMQTRYQTETVVHYEQPRNGLAESRMRIDSRYLGACPTDMKPGETRMSGVPTARSGRGGVTTDVNKIKAMNPKERERWAEQLEEQLHKQAAASAAASATKK